MQQVAQPAEHHSGGQKRLLARVRPVARHKVDGVRRVAHLQRHVPLEVLLAVNRVEGHLSGEEGRKEGTGEREEKGEEVITTIIIISKQQIVCAVQYCREIVEKKVAPFKVVAKQTFEELTADEDRLLLITTSLLLVLLLLLLVVGLLVVVVVLLLLFDGSAVVVVVVVSSLSPLLSDDGGGDGGCGAVSTSTLTTLKEMSGSRELGSMRYSSWRREENYTIR